MCVCVRMARVFAVARNGAGLDELDRRLSRARSRPDRPRGDRRVRDRRRGGLAGAGLPVVVVNPAQVRAFAQALGKRAKTDPIDAAVIAHFAEATRPEVRARCPTRRRSCSPISSPAGGRSSR